MLSIRAYQPADAPQLWHIFHDAVHQTASDHYSPEQVCAWAPEAPDPAAWQARMDTLNPFIAQVEYVIAAFADLQPSGYIDMFFVSPRFGRSGVGTALMQRILQAARACGVTELSSNVSITARPLFERHGFTVVTPQTVTVRGVEFTNYRMRRPL